MRELVSTKVVFNPETGELTVNGMDLGLLVDEVNVRFAGHNGAAEVTLRLPCCDVQWIQPELQPGPNLF